RYIPIVAAAHELMRMAARLADEAREIEKSNDSVSRVVHLRSGALRGKVKLLEELRKPSPSSPA
ncbi:MAG: F420-dependent methylenetetrahydromethanopterin dehydrogenase, partial [Candidatus Bathyarchaeia archaeon]